MLAALSSLRTYFLWTLLGAGAVFADELSESCDKRVRLPSPDELHDELFFEDAFRQGLTRPLPAARHAGPSRSAERPDSAPASQWSTTIRAETIEDEIKAIQRRVAGQIANPSQFKGQGFREVRRDLNVAAVLFKVISEYDADVRWTRAADPAQTLFARTAAQLTAGSAEGLQLAAERDQDLQDLVRGANLQHDGTLASEWSEVADRAVLMQRLETALEQVIRPGASSEQRFEDDALRLVHECELTAMIATVLAHETMEDAIDEEYRQAARQLKEAATEISRATQEGNYETSRQAAAAVQQSCIDCHEVYRG